MKRIDVRISDIVKLALKEADLKKGDLASKFGISEAVMKQKFYLSNWDGSDLARIAEYTGGKLILAYPNGHYYQIYADRDVRKKPKSDTDDLSARVVSNNDYTIISEESVSNPTAAEDGNSSIREADNNHAPLSFEETSSIDDIASSQNTSIPSESTPITDPRYTGNYRQIDYTETDLGCTPLTKSDYKSPLNKNEIVRRADIIIKNEAPIRKDILTKKIHSSFNVPNTSDITEVTEKAWGARRYKSFKYGEFEYYWEKGVNPETYMVFRTKSQTQKELSEVSPHELKNAICYILTQNNGKMDVNDLIAEVSRLYGYKRAGQNIKDTIKTAINFSRKVKAIEGKNWISLKSAVTPNPN